MDLGANEFYDQHRRTSEDRWPDGYPAAPGSPDYDSTTLAQREALRAARWVAAMERGGVYRWWVRGVPTDPGGSFRYEEAINEQVREKLEALREYQTAERYNDQAPAHLAWAYPRHWLCHRVALIKFADHANTGLETLPCEVVLDWALWWVEEFTSPSVISESWYDRTYTVAYRKAAVLLRSLAEPPTDPLAISTAVGSSDSLLVYQGGIVEALGWVFKPSGVNPRVHYTARDDAHRHFSSEVRDGRRPWESVP